MRGKLKTSYNDEGVNKRFLGVYNPACLVTLSGLFAALAALIMATLGSIELALVGLIFAGIADLFDGVIARRLQLDFFSSEYGVQLDTTVDVVAFVILPMVISLSLSPVTWVGAFCSIWFVIAGVVRLAHFNTLSVRGVDQSTHHSGLPVTYTALIFPLLFILLEVIPGESFRALLNASLVVIGLLFTINVPVPKPRGYFYIVLPILAIGLSLFWIGQYFNWFFLN